MFRYVNYVIAEKLAATHQKTVCLEEMNKELDSQKSKLDDLVLELNRKIEDLQVELGKAQKHEERLKKEAEDACVKIYTVEESLQNSESKVCR